MPEMKQFRATPSQEWLQHRLFYDSDVGVFTWTENAHYTCRGKIVGCPSGSGYLIMVLEGRKFYCHRVAWKYAYGQDAMGYIDHINGVRSDNRISNLRLADCSQNVMNSGLRSDNKCGFKGVSWHDTMKKWRACINVSGVQRVVGYYLTPEEASTAYDQAATAIFGNFARTNEELSCLQP